MERKVYISYHTCMRKYDEKSLKIEVGKLIVQKRRAIKMSQETLAEKLDIHVRTVGKIENGKAFPTAETFCRLSEVFNVPVKSFFEFYEMEDLKENDLDILINKLQNSDNDFVKLYLNIIIFINSKCYK